MGIACELARRAVEQALGSIQPPSLFRAFNVALQIRDRLAGGIPRNPDVVRAWLESRMEPGAAEEAAEQTLEVLEGVEEKVWQGFKRDAAGLFLEERNIKAMIKESAFQLELTRERGFRDDISHGTFVKPERIRFLRAGKAVADQYGSWYVEDGEELRPVLEPDGTETVVSHIVGPGGRRSALKKFDFVVQPILVFQIWTNKKGALVTGAKGGDLGVERIKEILQFAQELGLGANRSMGWGKFDLLICEEVAS